MSVPVTRDYVTRAFQNPRFDRQSSSSLRPTRPVYCRKCQHFYVRHKNQSVHGGKMPLILSSE